MDQRDDLTWVAIELSHLGDTKVQDGTLAHTIKLDLGVNPDFPVFVPATTYKRGARTITLHLLEGYIFVASGLPETSYFALERRPYVAQVMSGNSGPHRIRTLSVITNERIEELRRQLRQMVSQDIREYDKVKVLKGVHRGLEGEVLLVFSDTALVRFKMRSLDQIATVPLAFLDSSQAILED
jgi:transcription antitermination factor NusG